MVKSAIIDNTYVVGTQRQFQCVPSTYVTENKVENYLEFYIFQVSCPLTLTSFKHSKLPIRIKIPVTLLQIVYICMTAIPPNSC